MGLYEFCRMPVGVTGGPSSFQRLMDKVLHGLSFVTSYIDDVLIRSSSMELHQSHLRLVFNRLAKAGLTLRGSNCKIELHKVQYLSHIFSKDGMAPDTDKIAVVQNWPTPRHRGMAVPGVSIILSTICEKRFRYCSSSPSFHTKSSGIQLGGKLRTIISGVERCVDSSACLMLSLLQEGIHPTDKCQCSGDRSSAGVGQSQLNPPERQYNVIEPGMPGCCLCSQTLQALLIGTTIQPTH